jgi:hypothetical protein
MADWVGFDPDNRFYDASSNMNSPHKIQEYHEAYPDEPGPPARLDVWLRAYQNEDAWEPTDEDRDHLAAKEGVKWKGLGIGEPERRPVSQCPVRIYFP